MKGVDDFVSQRLTEAREVRGMTKSSLADIVGISPSQITKYEKDEQSPSPGILGKISLTLGVPIDYFFYKREVEIDRESTVFYRSLSSATKRQREAAVNKYIWLQDMYSYLRGFIDFPKVNLPDFNPPKYPEVISSDFVEECAKELREYWGVSDSPIDNITRLAENNGFVISFCDLEADTLDAFSQYCFHKQPYLMVSTRRASAVRIRFNIAHEIGHLILHKNIPGSVFRKGEYFKAIEKQAHHFARAFIFPQSAFWDEVKTPSLDTFRLRKLRWGLSIAAMIFRSEDLDLITEQEAESLRRAYGRKRWRTFEPFDDEIQIEHPELLKDAFEMLVSAGVQTKSEILDALKLRRQDVERIAGLDENFLEENVVKLKLKNNSQTPKVVNLGDYR